VMLATLDKEELRDRFSRRTDAAPHRQRERYLDYFDEIWEIQSYMLECADHAGVPIVTSQKLADTVQAVIDLVTVDLSRRHPPDLEKL
jgi:2-phosphoglycerate kinase